MKKHCNPCAVQGCMLHQPPLVHTHVAMQQACMWRRMCRGRVDNCNSGCSLQHMTSEITCMPVSEPTKAHTHMSLIMWAILPHLPSPMAAASMSLIPATACEIICFIKRCRCAKPTVSWCLTCFYSSVKAAGRECRTYGTPRCLHGTTCRTSGTQRTHIMAERRY